MRSGTWDEFYAGKRKQSEYPDWREWLEKRLSAPKTTGFEAEKIVKGGDNFRFVCWTDITELKLWSRP